jgi:hypothetical protein
MRIPRLTAERALGPALGVYLAGPASPFTTPGAVIPAVNARQVQDVKIWPLNKAKEGPDYGTNLTPLTSADTGWFDDTKVAVTPGNPAVVTLNTQYAVSFKDAAQQRCRLATCTFKGDPASPIDFTVQGPCKFFGQPTK